MSLLKRNVAANAFGQSVGVLTSLILVPLYVRFLGSEGFGLMGFLLSIQAMAGIFDLGLSATANREISRLAAPGGEDRRDLLRTLELAYSAIGLTIFAMALLGSAWAARSWIQAHELTPETIRICLIIAGATITLRLQGGIYQGVLRGLEQQVKLNVFISASTLGQAVVTILFLVTLRPSVSMFFLYQLVLVALEFALLRRLAWRALKTHGSGPPRFRGEYIRDVWRFALSVNAITIFAIGIKQIDRLVISSMLPISSLGYYTAAALAATGISKIGVPLQTAIFPRFTRLLADDAHADARALFGGSVQLVSFAMCAAAGGVCFFSYEILLVWTQSPDLADQAYVALSVLAAAMMLNGMMAPPFSLILAAGLPAISLCMNAAGFVVLVPLTYFLVKGYGLTGAAAALLLFNCAYYFIVPWVLASKLSLVDAGMFYLRDTLPYVLIAVAAFGTGKYLSTGFGIYAALAVAVVSGFCYLALAIAVSPGLRRMARDSVSLLMRRP